MKSGILLTPSESKRLIAMGVANLPMVRKALVQGTIAIAKGTTNSYVVEEMLGIKINKAAYITGVTLPVKRDKNIGLDQERLPDFVLKKGEVVRGLTVVDAVKEFVQGDVFIKGANALNYEKKVGGILIGNPTGGTIGATLGTLISRRAHLVIPVGLEKLVAGDIWETSRTAGEDDEFIGECPRLYPVTGEIVTEIEALQVLAGVNVFQLGAGGIAGAEGAVRLIVSGEKDQVRKALGIVESIQGEPPFAGATRGT